MCVCVFDCFFGFMFGHVMCRCVCVDVSLCVYGTCVYLCVNVFVLCVISGFILYNVVMSCGVVCVLYVVFHLFRIVSV